MFPYDFQGKPGLPGNHGDKGSEGPRGPAGISGLDGFPGLSVGWMGLFTPVSDTMKRVVFTLMTACVHFFRDKRATQERKERWWEKYIRRILPYSVFSQYNVNICFSYVWFCVHLCDRVCRGETEDHLDLPGLPDLQDRSPTRERATWVQVVNREIQYVKLI